MALDCTIDKLKAARDALDRLAQDCARSDTDRCPIIAAFEERREPVEVRPARQQAVRRADPVR